MAYDMKSDLEDINGERYYYLWTRGHYIVYHWDRVTQSLEQISRDFFINIEMARACAREDAEKVDYKERLIARIQRLQEELQDLEVKQCQSGQ